MATNDPTQVAIVTGPSGQGVTAPRTNPALLLADSLQGVNSELTPFLGQLASQLRDKATAQANADALKVHGAALADAVRDGRLEATQNPWYVQAYEKQAAQVNSQGQMAQLQADSQQWAERNDPKAFAAKFQAEAGKIAENYTGINQAEGFRAAADPIVQQALASNVNYNAERVQQETVQNTTALMTQALVSAYQANPKATPEDLYSLLDTYHDTWVGTGGTEQNFLPLVKGAFLAAAANVGDASFADNLRYNRTGQGSLYNLVDANGNTWADDIETAKYRIDRAQVSAGLAQVHKQQAAIELEGYGVQTWAYQKWGLDLVKGNVSAQDILTEGTAQGFSPQGIQAFLKMEASDLSANNTYAKAQLDQFSNDPEASTRILNLRVRALKGGLTPALQDDVEAAVRTGMIDSSLATSILDQASATSQHFESEARSDRREAQAREHEDHWRRQQSAVEFKQGVSQQVGRADTILQQHGDKSLAAIPAVRAQVERTAVDAGNNWLIAHKDDYVGAQAAAENAVASFVKARLARRRPQQPGKPASRSANPRDQH